MAIYSYSRINTYFTCPAQFRFRYIEKRPSPAAEGIELFLGSRFHETMEFLYQLLPQRIPKVNEVVDHFKAQWEKRLKEALQKQGERGYPETLRVVQEGKSAGDYFEKGQLFVENYYHQYHPFDQDKTEGVELKVAFNLDPEGRYRMQGFIDRLGRDGEGTLWIHDYKTSSRKMSEEDARTEDQLALYQIGLSQNPRYGSAERIKLIWHFVAFEKDQVVGERNAKEIEWLKQKYVSKIQTIEKASTFPTKPGVLCQWCEYLTVCPEGQGAVAARRAKQREKGGLSDFSKVPSLSSVPPALPSEKPSGEIIPAAWTVPSFGSGTRPGRKKASTSSPDQLPLF
jgi:putative RecB family exonuclease